MMKIKTILFIFLLGSVTLSSQGFDWQYSARLPFETPTQFWGLNVGGSYILNTGEFGFLSNNIPCCTFESGSGIGFKGGLKYENWFADNFTAFSSLNFSYLPSTFKVESEPYVYRDFEDLITEYEYNSILTYIEFELGSKFRILNTHFFLGLSLNTSYLLSEKHEFLERAISRKDFFFSEITYSNAQYNEPRKLILSTNVLIGYDLNLGKGKYASLYLNGGIPVQSVISEKVWNRWLFSIGISSYLYGY